MPKVVKTTDVPSDPKRLYIYLYCDKLGCYKSTTKKKAAKSWLSLSESKRRRFLKTCRLKKDLNNTQRVLSTEPFLKQLYNSTVEDISSKNIKNKEQNDSCFDGNKDVQYETCLDNGKIEQNEICLHDQQQNETSLVGGSEVQNESCLDSENEVQIERCLDNDIIEQNETCLHEQQKNKTSLDGNDRLNNKCLENVDTEEQNHLVVIVVDESLNNDKDQQRDIERHLDVNSICKEINGSDAESLSNTEEQRNEGIRTGGNERNANDSKVGFINNIKEPIAPTVKNWKELYVVLNKDKNIKYQDVNVSDTVKRTYQVLFTKIRKEYIEHYIQYLESLSDKQLYEHYLKES